MASQTGEGFVGDKVLGTYERDTLSDKVLGAYKRDTLSDNYDCWHSQQKNNLLSSTRIQCTSVEFHTLSEDQMLEKLTTIRIVSSHGNRTDDSYEM